MCSFFILAWQRKPFLFTVVQFEASHPLVMYELSHERPRFVTLSSHILLKPWVLAGLVALFFYFYPISSAFRSRYDLWFLVPNTWVVFIEVWTLHLDFALVARACFTPSAPPSPRGLGMGWGEGALTPHFHSNQSSTFCNLCDFNP